MGPIANSARRLTQSLRIRFLVALLALAVLPLVAVAAILGQHTFGEIERQTIARQRDAAAMVGLEVEAAIRTAHRDLVLLDQTMGLGPADAETTRSVLRTLLANQTMYQALALVDVNGNEVFRLARDRAVPESDLTNRAGETFFAQVTTTGNPYFGPVVFDDEVREPLTTIAHPLIDRRTGALDSVLVATVTFEPIWELLGTVDLPRNYTVYVLNAEGEVVAHRNPGVVLRGARRPVPLTDGRASGLAGDESVIIATYPVKAGNRALVVVAEQPLAAALDVATHARRVTFVVTLLAILGVFGFTVLVIRKIVRPVEDLAQSARRVAAGDLSHRARVSDVGEIGDLAEAFNSMTAQLDEMVATLEQRVGERTRDLESSTREQWRLIAQLEAQNERMAMIQRRLEHSIKSKDEFLGSVSHELRTPLASIVGFASLLRDRPESFAAEEREELIEMIATQGQDMSDIIDDLLVVARAEIGTLAVESTSFEIDANLRAVVEQLPEANVRVAVTDPAARVRADERRVRQILRNLIVNAVRYGGEDISVVVHSNPEACVVLVRDNGEGIPVSEWESIFDPYHRADRNGKVNPASIGLGLTVSRKLARLMGGDLTYRYEGGHSVFSLTLPQPGKAQPAGAVAATAR